MTSSGSPSRFHSTLPYLLLSVLSIWFGVAECAVPIGLDQGILCYVARDILDGGVPYLTTWDHKPPGAHLMVTLAFAVFGDSQLSLRVFDLVYILALVLVTCRVGTLLFSPTAGFFAGLLFLIAYYTRMSPWNTCQPDAFTLLPVMLAIWLTLTDPGGQRRWTSLSVGACLGVAFVVKFVAIVALVPILFWCWVHRQRLLRELGLGALGFLIPVLAATSWLAAHGAWPGFVDAVLVFNRGYAQVGRQPAWMIVGGIYVLDAWLLVLLALLSVAGLRRRLVRYSQRGRGGLVFALLLLVMFAAEAIAQGKFYGYHLIPMLLAASLLAGACLSWIGKIPRAGLLLATALCLGTFLPRTGDQLRRLFPVAQSEAAHRQQYRDGDGFSYPACYDAATFLRQHTAASDMVYVWGFDPVVNYLAERRVPTRYTYNTPLIVAWRRPEWRRQFLDDLEKNRPRYFLVLKNDQHPWTTGRAEDSATLLPEFGELVQFVTQAYELETTIEDYMIFRRR